MADKHVSKNKISDLKKSDWKNYIITAVIVLMIEVFLWNHSFWLSLGNEPIAVDELYIGADQLLAPDSGYVLEAQSFIEIRNINQKVENVYLNIQTNKEEKRDTLTVRLSMIDAGSKSYYNLPVRVISSKLNKLNYISVYPYGDLKSLKISFPAQEGTEIAVKNIALNARVPMFFSKWRVMLMYAAYLLIRILFCKPYETYYQADSKRQRRAALIICILSAYAVFLLTLKGDDDEGRSTMDQYKDLTHAFAQGSVALPVDVDERLLAAQNPYDPEERDELGLGMYKWDHAYYNGKLYVYFGAVPVLLAYLPYYILTGRDLPHIAPYMIFLMLHIIGAFKLMDEMAKKYCKKLPLKLYYLFLATFMLGTGTMIFAKRVCIYNLAIMAGVCFTVWGLYWWISSQAQAGKCIYWRVFLGAVCMALVAGCRPQLILGSFLAFPIMGQTLKWVFGGGGAKKKERLLFIMAVSIPYIVIASGLMWYNCARFDSPFNFGAAYNLTTNDMRYRGANMARMIGGVWSFLFKPPTVSTEFPYIGTTWLYTEYQGVTIQERGIGGIFATNLILLPAFLIYRLRDRLRDKKLLLFAAISMAGGAIIACADVQIAGVVTRYMADFAVFFYMAAFAVIFSLIDACYEKGYALLCRGLAFLCCATMLYCCITILQLYVSGDYDVYQSVWYYHLKEVLGVLDV